jgi:Bax protein
MTLHNRRAAAARAVVAAVVLSSAAGCTSLSSAPARADDQPANASRDTASDGPAAPRPASTDTSEATPKPGLIAAERARLQPPLVRVRKLDLDRVREGVQLVPQAQVGDLPDRLTELDRARERKRLFIKTMLPAVLRANAAIQRERDFVQTLRALEIPPDDLPEDMRRKLERLADKYQVAPDNLGELARRVDIVPPALVLAQAAIETGWGTSRFAQQGNAIFGQHTRDPDDPGMVPQGLEDPSFRVRAFETVTGAVEAYLRNLNTHPAYAELRARRADARARGDYPDGPDLAAGLVDYSARGWDYVEDIRLTIRANDLQAFAEARLRPRADRLVDAGDLAEP